MIVINYLTSNELSLKSCIRTKRRFSNACFSLAFAGTLTQYHDTSSVVIVTDYLTSNELSLKSCPGTKSVSLMRVFLKHLPGFLLGIVTQAVSWWSLITSRQMSCRWNCFGTKRCFFDACFMWAFVEILAWYHDTSDVVIDTNCLTSNELSLKSCLETERRFSNACFLRAFAKILVWYRDASGVVIVTNYLTSNELHWNLALEPKGVSLMLVFHERLLGFLLDIVTKWCSDSQSVPHVKWIVIEILPWNG